MPVPTSRFVRRRRPVAPAAGPVRSRLAVVPPANAGALAALTAVGQALRFAADDGGGLTAEACESLLPDLRSAFRAVRALRPLPG